MKEIMEGYEGVKFRTMRLRREAPSQAANLLPRFRRTAERLKRHGMTPQNGGNMSLKLPEGMVITASGANLGRLEDGDLVLVAGCCVEDPLVDFMGEALPSSEALMHHLIYESRPEITAIVHTHDSAFGENTPSNLRVTQREEPYGTVALARIACHTLGEKETIIMLRNHGYVAVGKDLDDAADRIIATHLEVLEAR